MYRIQNKIENRMQLHLQRDASENFVAGWQGHVNDWLQTTYRT